MTCFVRSCSYYDKLIFLKFVIKNLSAELNTSLYFQLLCQMYYTMVNISISHKCQEICELEKSTVYGSVWGLYKQDGL